MTTGTYPRRDLAMRKFRWLAALGAALALLLGSATPALASNSSGPSSFHAFQLVFNSWPTILAGIVGFVSSQLTALFTHHRAPQWIKSGLNLGLVTLGSVLATITTVPGHTWKDYVGEILAAWVVSLGTHFSGLTALVQSATSDFGFGANTAPIVQPTGTTVTSTVPITGPAAVATGPGTVNPGPDSGVY